jgi:hypothetical protein
MMGPSHTCTGYQILGDADVVDCPSVDIKCSGEFEEFVVGGFVLG